MNSPHPFLPLTFLVAALSLAGSANALPWFEEVAGEAGIDFDHAGWTLAEHNEWFPEITPGGLCWFDYDGDGWQDLYFVTARLYNQTLQDERQPTSELYRNRGDGTFEDVTAEAGVGLTGRWDTSCSSADYDGDGWEDLFVAGYDQDVLLKNQGDGTFRDVTVEAGVVDDGLCTNPCWGHSSSWIDYDMDGDLDLYVLNYVSWNQTIHTGNGPRQYHGQTNLMWQNQGDGTFLEVSEQSNTTDDPQPMHGKGLGAVWFDHNLDGCPDVYIASDQTPASLLLNDCNGRFENIAADAHVNDNYSGMGTIAGDTTGDGRYDLYKTHYQGEPNTYYVWDDDGIYDPYTHYGDLGRDLDFVGWGTGFFDFDNDGHLDVYVANGHTEHLEDWYGLTINGWQQNLIWLNDGDGNFTDVSNQTGPGWLIQAPTRGSAVADFDLDGDLDVAFNNNGNGTGHLLEATNVTHAGNWLSIDLRQPGANWQAAGARLEATLPNGHTMTRHVMLGSGYLSQDQRALHLGLGDQVAVDVLVRWPNGDTDEFLALAANQFLRLEKGGVVVEDTLAPLTELVQSGPEGLDGWYVGPATLSLSASDSSRGVASGVAETRWRLDGDWMDYQGAATLGEGITQVEYTSLDGAGNQERLRRTTISVDPTPPTTTATVEGTLGDSGWYTDAVHVALTASDATSGVSSTQYRLAGDWVDYQGAITLEDGTHVLQWRSRDVAGNWEPTQTTTIRVDTQAPETDILAQGPSGHESWFVGATQADAAATDDVSGPRATWSRIDDGPWREHAGPVVLGEGRHTVEAYSVDRAGNTEPVRSMEIAVDPTPPETVATVEGQLGHGGWYTGPATITLAGSDATSGVRETRYSTGDDWNVYAQPVVLDDGVHDVSFFSRDGAGNVEAANSLQVKVDTVAPASTLEIAGERGTGGWWISEVDLEVVATDATAGVANRELRIDGRSVAGAAANALPDGRYLVHYRSIDAAGNLESLHERQIDVDTIAPSLIIEVTGTPGEGGWLVSNATVAATASDTNSGVARIEYNLGSGWQTYTAPLTLTEGVHELSVRAVDLAGNAAPTQHQVVRVDTTLPEIAIAIDGMYLWRGEELDVVTDTVFTLSSGYDLSGVAWTEYSLNGGPWLATGQFTLDGPDGTHHIAYRARDLAGNHGDAGGLVVHVHDTTPPTLRLIHPQSDNIYLGRDHLRTHLGVPAVVGGCVPVRALTHEHVSGTRFLAIRIDGVEVASWHWDDWSPAGVNRVWTWNTLQWMPGPHTVEVEAVDHMGNVALHQRNVWTLGAPSDLPWCSLRD